MNRNDIALINKKLGTAFPLNATVVDESNINIAMDADYVAGTPQTAANAGIPAFLTTWLDPAFIDALVAPMRMAEIFSEVQKGGITDLLVQFPVRELSGSVSTYGDFNDNGIAGSNMNWVVRQPYHYQTHVKIGSLATEMAAAARYDLVSSEIESNLFILNKFQNQSYLYGIDGLQNYGMLNDPSLTPDIIGINWYSATAEQVYAEFQRLYNKLVQQAQGSVKSRDPMTLLLSPAMEAHLHKTNSFGLNVYDLLTKNFPALKIESVPEYSTAAGEKLQLLLDSYMGRKTAELAFTTKLRSGIVETKTTGWLQKRSQSTLGAIIYRPMFIANMMAVNDDTP